MYCKLIIIFRTGSLDDAKLYIERKRPIPPATYNPRRLKERPLPLLFPNPNPNDLHLNRTLPVVRLNLKARDANLQRAASTSSSVFLTQSPNEVNSQNIANVSSSSAEQMMSRTHDQSEIDSQNMSQTTQNNSVNWVDLQSDNRVSSSSGENTGRSQSIQMMGSNVLRDITNTLGEEFVDDGNEYGNDDENGDDDSFQFEDVDRNDADNAVFDDDVMIRLLYIFYE